MLRVNLLPYREEARQERKRQFLLLCALTAAAACLVAFLIYSWTSAQVQEQEESNEFLRGEIKKLQKEIEHIAGLKAQVEALKSRKQVIESLQIDRGETILLLTELVAIVPEGVFIRSMKQEGAKISLSGVAQSNARVSSLMSNIEMSKWLDQPQLIETKASTVDKRRVHEFSLTFLLVRNKGKPGEAKGGAVR